MNNQISIKEQFAEAQRILDRIRAIHEQEDELQFFFTFRPLPHSLLRKNWLFNFFAVYMPLAQGDVIKEDYLLNMTVKIGLFNLLQVWSG